MPGYFFAFWGAVFAGLAVVFGAFGAHALKNTLDAYSLSIWEKAVFYQVIHALALLLLPLYAEQIGARATSFTGGLFIAGIFLFSGSLYILAFTGKKYFGAITPVGGVAFIIAWGWLAVSLMKSAMAS